jgi:hypothetical protein
VKYDLIEYTMSDGYEGVSCELCKIRKVRCDRGKPSCGWLVPHFCGRVLLY